MIATREFRPSMQAVTRAMAQDARAQGTAWLRKWMLVLIAGIAVWSAYQLVSSGDSRLLFGMATGLVAAGLFWGAVVWLVPRLVERAPHNKSAFTLRPYKFDAEALFLETADGVVLKAPYRSFSRIVLRPDCILFYEGFPGLATHAIPGHVFETAEQEKAVRDWLGAYAS
jgi:hypothetical protein